MLVRACKLVPLPLALVDARPEAPVPAAIDGLRNEEAEDEPLLEEGKDRLGEPGWLERGVLGSCSSFASAGEGMLFSRCACYVLRCCKILSLAIG